MSTVSAAPDVKVSTDKIQPTTTTNSPTNPATQPAQVPQSGEKMAEKDKKEVADDKPQAANVVDAGATQTTEKSATAPETSEKTSSSGAEEGAGANGNPVSSSEQHKVEGKSERGEPSSAQATLTSTDPKTTADGHLKPSAGTDDTHGRAGSKSSRKSADSSSKRKKGKKSIFSAILSLVPCIHSSSAHPPDLDLPDNASSASGGKPAEKSTAATPPPTSTQIAKDKPQAEAEEKPTQTSDRPATPVAATTTTPDQAAAIALPPSPPPPTTPTRSQTSTPDGSVTQVTPTPTRSHLLPRDETAGLMSGAVQPPGSTGHEDEEQPVIHVPTHTDDEEGEQHGEANGHDADAEQEAASDDDEERLIIQGGIGIPIVDGQPRPLLPPVLPAHKGRKCLVLDLDETLLHSSFKLIPQCDYVVPVEIEWQWHNVYVIKRPGVDQFLKKMGELYEIVVFTASLSKYADPVLDKLDVHKVVTHRLFRESCYNHKGNYVKDLSQLGRPLTETIILDNSPASYIFHPNNAVPVSSWFNDPHDTELTDLCPFLTDLRLVDDVRGVLDGGL